MDCWWKEVSGDIRKCPSVLLFDLGWVGVLEKLLAERFVCEDDLLQSILGQEALHWFPEK